MIMKEISYVCPIPLGLELPEVVYKYREVNERLLGSLLLGQVWLPKPESLNDPFEPERIFSGSRFGDALDRDIREAGVFCLCKSRTNLSMWSYYGGGLKGVAIGYDLRAFLESLAPVEPSNDEGSTRWKYIFDLRYCSKDFSAIDEMALLKNNHFTDEERQKMFATKSPAYQHEEECRIVVQPSPDSKKEFSWVGHGLYEYDKRAVREIVFGELISNQMRKAIAKIVEGRDVKLFDASRSKSRFEIVVSPREHG